MGCDFFYEGNLPDEKLQEKVINFAKDYFQHIDLFVNPDLCHDYFTEIKGPIVGYERTREEFVEYPFNYFGFIPQCKDEHGISEHGQFIFNRNDDGRLVRILRLPDSYTIVPTQQYQVDLDTELPKLKHEKISGMVISSEEFKKIGSLPIKAAKPKHQIVLEDGGYHRTGGGLGLALLLIICKLRWWPELSMGDDYENCETVEGLIAKYDFEKILKDENNNFETCYDLFFIEYNKDFPPPSPPQPFSIPKFVGLDILGTSTLDLELSVRSKCYLKNNNIITLNELLMHSGNDLREKRFGKKSIVEINRIIMELGLLLHDSTEEFLETEGSFICTTIAPDNGFAVLARQYVEFMEKIKPYLKPKKGIVAMQKEEELEDAYYKNRPRPRPIQPPVPPTRPLTPMGDN